ncbi:MAG: DUF3306 domain-containing protein [Rhizobiales bacterium]|nr:DUF3306 domain-containing protein [Hyphomicrobiales bacterium]
MSDEPKDDGFLSRWSRRKRAIAAGEDLPEPVAPEAAGALKGGKADAAAADLREQVWTENRLAAEAVDFDTLNFESDFKLFLKDGVPGPLRQKALDTLWRSNPILANLDGLNDYEENFADPARIMPTFESAYRIGKGYFFPEAEETAAQTDETVHDVAEGEDVAAARAEGSDESDLAEAETADEDATRAQLTEAPDRSPERPEAESETDTQSGTQSDIGADRPRVSLRRRLQFAS